MMYRTCPACDGQGVLIRHVRAYLMALAAFLLRLIGG
jgi:hypothetical protein